MEVLVSDVELKIGDQSVEERDSYELRGMANSRWPAPLSSEPHQSEASRNLFVKTISLACSQSMSFTTVLASLAKLEM